MLNESCDEKICENKEHKNTVNKDSEYVHYELIESKNSLQKCYWRVAHPEERLIANIRQKFGISDILARILINRRIHENEIVEHFLYPKIKNLMPDPYLLHDMDRAVERVCKAIENNEKITIFADYDVDGATSSSLLRRFFKMIGIEVDIYVPNRMSEGYGPSPEAFQKIRANGTNLVITVDCGTGAFEAMEAAERINLDVIVVDHHMSADELPNSKIIVNPNKINDNFPIKSIAAVTVAFLFSVAINKKLRNSGWYVENNIEEPDLFSLLDLVALGTVCDVMPLLGLNRALVVQGLKILRQRKNVGLKKLANFLKIDAPLQSYHLGYVLGPRINAGGRVGAGHLGVTLLTTDDEVEAIKVIEELELLNEERKTIESIAVQEAVEQITKSGHDNEKIIIALGDWHIGILGIIASRIKSKYHKPAVIMSLLDDGNIKGSARSITGIDIGNAIAVAKEKMLLVNGGGHVMAGGFTLYGSKLQEFKDFLNTYIEEHEAHSDEVFDNAKNLDIDAVLSVSAINAKLVEEINLAAPFGNANPQPKFLIKDAVLTHVRVVGGIHIMGFITDRYKQKTRNSVKFYNPSETIKIMIFKGTENEMGRTLLTKLGSLIDVVGTLQTNNIDPNKVEIMIEDIAIVE